MHASPKHIDGQSLRRKATKTSKVILTITKELLKSQRNTCRGNWYLIFFVAFAIHKSIKEHVVYYIAHTKFRFRTVHVVCLFPFKYALFRLSQKV